MLQQPATPRIPAHVREVLSLPLGELELELPRLWRACDNMLVRSNARSAMRQLERLLRWYHVNTSRGLQHLDTHLFSRIVYSRVSVRCVCVTLGIIGILLDFSRGAVGILEVTAQRRHFKFAVICNLDADCTYLHFSFSEWHEAKPRTSTIWYYVLHVAAVTHGTPSPCRTDLVLSLCPLSLFLFCFLGLSF